MEMIPQINILYYKLETCLCFFPSVEPLDTHTLFIHSWACSGPLSVSHLQSNVLPWGSLQLWLPLSFFPLVIFWKLEFDLVTFWLASTKGLYCLLPCLMLFTPAVHLLAFGALAMPRNSLFKSPLKTASFPQAEFTARTFVFRLFFLNSFKFLWHNHWIVQWIQLQTNE